MSNQTLILTPDVVQLVAGLVSLLHADLSPIDLRLGIAIQEFMDKAYDILDERIQMSLTIPDA